MPVINDVLGLLAKAPPGVVSAVVSLVRSVLSSDDPLRVAKRAAAAAASEVAAENTIRRAMKQRAKR